MKFPDLKDGDRVVLWHTDNCRTYFDMIRPIAVVTVSGVMERSFVVNGKRYSRQTGDVVGPRGCSNLHVRPYTDGIEDEITACKKSSAK